MQIWKMSLCELSCGAIVQAVIVPLGSRFLSVKKEQEEDLFAYYLVNPETEEFEGYIFHAVGTGKDFQYSGKEYVGTCSFDGGDLVLHIFMACTGLARLKV